MKAFKDLTKLQIFQTVEGPGVVKKEDMRSPTSVPVMTTENCSPLLDKPAKKVAKRSRRKRATKNTTTTGTGKE